MQPLIIYAPCPIAPTLIIAIKMKYKYRFCAHAMLLTVYKNIISTKKCIFFKDHHTKFTG
jgi:hypothetical protein